MLISDEYRALNAALHRDRHDYGIGGGKWANLVGNIAGEHGIKTILDYGAGKGALARTLPLLDVVNYDPAIPGIDEPPGPAEMVVSTDVLEHVEPAFLDDVLDDIARLAQRIVVLVVATRPAVKTLADGRNAHLIVEPVGWWLPRLMQRFVLAQVTNNEGHEFVFVGVPK